MSRTAAQLPEHELEDFQRAARGLLATGLVTATWPTAGLLPVVRRFESVLRAELSQVFGWALRVDARSARVLRSPLQPDRRRGARLTERGSSNTNRPFRPRDYALLCLVLAALEAESTQTTIRRLVTGVERARSGREDLPVDFATAADRRSFVTAVAWLVHIGVLDESPDSDTFRFIDDREADALYTVDHDLARRLLGPLPPVLDPAGGLDGLIAAQPVAEGEHPARQRLAQRLIEQPAVYYAELDEAERRVLTDRRVELSSRIERLTGCQVETRAEGLALIDPDARVRLGALATFPGNGNVGNVAAAYAGALLSASNADSDGSERPVGRLLTRRTVDRAWMSVLAAHRSSLSLRWAADIDGLRSAATTLLVGLGLLDTAEVPGDQGGREETLLLRPLAARFGYPPQPDPGLFEERL